MVVAGRLERHSDGKIVFRQQSDQPVEFGAGVRNRQAPAPRLSGHRDKNLVAMLGYIDAYEDDIRSCRMVGGHRRRGDLAVLQRQLQLFNGLRRGSETVTAMPC